MSITQRPGSRPDSTAADRNAVFLSAGLVLCGFIVLVVATAFHPSGVDPNNHPATFPEQLAADHILTWSKPGDVILDPMCGSATVCVAAKGLGRNFIGIDISREYCELATRRLDCACIMVSPARMAA